MTNTLSFNIKAFFSLSHNHRAAVLWFFYQEILRRKRQIRAIFYRVSNIAKKLLKFSQRKKCSDRTVQRFNSSVRGWLFEIIPCFDPERRNRQTTNEYRMTDSFFKALVWLDRRNLLKVQKGAFRQVIEESERFESIGKIKMSPLPPQKCHPFILTLKETQVKEYSYVNPKIQELPFDLPTKVMLSKYPEYAIVSGLEDIKWYLKTKPDVPNPVGLVLERIRKKLKVIHARNYP